MALVICPAQARTASAPRGSQALGPATFLSKRSFHDPAHVLNRRSCGDPGGILSKRSLHAELADAMS